MQSQIQLNQMRDTVARGDKIIREIGSYQDILADLEQATTTVQITTRAEGGPTRWLQIDPKDPETIVLQRSLKAGVQEVLNKAIKRLDEEFKLL